MTKSEDWLWELGNNHIDRFIQEYMGNRRFINMVLMQKGG